MKTLIVSIKNTNELLDGALKVFKAISARKMKGSHYEISFSSKKSFDKFVKNIGLLKLIYSEKPKSIYELAKIAGMDVSNLNKIILFFEEAGALKVERKTLSGRSVTRPVVEYDKIEFNLAA